MNVHPAVKDGRQNNHPHNQIQRRGGLARDKVLNDGLQAQRQAKGHQAIQERKEVNLLDFGFEILQELEELLDRGCVIVVSVYRCCHEL
jgi:hypothetical protein